MISIKNLHASVEGNEILKGIDLEIGPGEVHAIMGPNGSGKSTLAAVLAGKEEYEISAGEVSYEGEDLLAMEPDVRAKEGVFLAFQYPVEIPGVSNVNFLKTSLNEILAHKGLAPLTAKEFLGRLKEKSALVELDGKLKDRSVNEGFSGGEKKRNDIFQMAMLEPRFAIMDETDSGLDIDALRIVAKGVNSMRNPERSFLIITHYQRLLDYIKPDFVHVLSDGKIVRSGGPELALKLEEEGYDWIKEGVTES